MSKADEMFEKLEYELKNDGKIITYQKEYVSIWNKPVIIFDTTSKLINLHDTDCLNIKILQAINEKVKELGWIK